ncbi:toxin glutamine deamidase domain-containing protein [Mycolicibacterium litorale]|uniref:toxin glutamine deamidase domain-containing protein n=1 Tax=Mycolicibacterium litorale TaxID=758802 RepID=UPI0039A23BF9
MRIEVDPPALIQAGGRLGSLGTQLGMLSDALGSLVSSGIASGTDPAGLDFGLKYGDQAQEFANGLADAANAFKTVGYMIEATGHNYANADAVSTVGGSGPTGALGGEPSQTTPGDAATGPNGTTVPPPTTWHVIVPFLNALPGGMFAGAALTWPSGSSGMMRLTAAQWRNLGQGLSVFDDAMAPVRTTVSAQKIPEGAKIGEALDKLGQATSELSGLATEVGRSIDTFADGVQETQDAIRRLLDRISLDGVWDTVKGIFTGEADDILREVARDVGTVLENFQRQVKGVVGLLEQLATAIGDAVTSLQKWVRPHLESLLGEEVGGALADAFTLYTDFQVGLTTGLINTVAGTVAMADPDTWKGMAEVAWSVAQDPTTLPGVLADMGKEFVAWDKWSSDHPGRAAGEAAFNIGSLFVPGGALSKTGTLARGLKATRGLLEDGRIPGLRGLGSGNSTPSLDNVPGIDDLGTRVPDVPEARPPAIPESLLNPTSPGGVDAPASPRGLEGPAGPPEPPGPAATPGGGDGGGIRGGDGPPPGPPGTSTGPPDSGPGRSDGPPPQSPAAPGPGSADTPANQPTTPNNGATPDTQTPPVTSHSPDSSSPAGPRDTAAEPRTPDTGDAPNATARPDAAMSPSPDRHTGDQASGHVAPNTVESHGQSDARVHTPADQPAAAHPPADNHHGGQERTASEANIPAQQPNTPVDGNAGRHESGTDTPPAGMAGIAPMAPHAAGPTYSASTPQSPEPPARGAETRPPDTRTPDSRASDARAATPPDNARAQQPTATGPTPGHTPSAPVNPAAAHAAPPVAGPTHATPEPHTARADGDRRDGPAATAQPTAHHAPGASGNDRPGNPGDGNSHHDSGPAHNAPHHSGPVGNPADARRYGPGELRPVEHPAYQEAVENALRDSGGDVRRYADPRTNDYGNLINDGGHTVPGRSNNCLDCSLSALSSFRGDPTVSAPRYPDLLPNGAIDTRSGERSGLQRASDWLGGPVTPVSPGLPIPDRYAELHQRISDMGPGSSALVVNEWHARDMRTGQPLYHPDGRPVIEGSHATVVVYPEGAAGPVWWDPQMRTTSDRPPASMIERSASLWATQVSPSEGGRGNAGGDAGTGAGVSGADTTGRDLHGASVRERVDLQGGHPSGGEPGARAGDGEPDHRQGDRSRDRSVEPADGSDRAGVRGSEADGQAAARAADLPAPVEDHGSPDRGGRGPDRVPADGGVVDQSARTDAPTSTDDPEGNLPARTDGLAVERGDGARGMGQSAEPGSVAGSGHDRGVGGRDPGEHDEPAHRPEAYREDADRPFEETGSTSNDDDGGSSWGGPEGEHAAGLLPADDSGYRILPRDCEFLGISPDQVEAWANREAPLGMTRDEFREFKNSLFDALAREGLRADDVDLRLQGSSARFFSGEHKSLPVESDISDRPEALERMATWFGGDENRPIRRPFDSMHLLGLEDEPSDYDIQVSSDRMVDACRERWEAEGSQGDLINRKYGFVNKNIFQKMFPSLWEWAEDWTDRTGRPVVPALFTSAGPPDTSSSGVSSHFRESDWRIQSEGNDP